MLVIFCEVYYCFVLEKDYVGSFGSKSTLFGLHTFAFALLRAQKAASVAADSGLILS